MNIKHLDKALVATGAAILLSGGVAAAAFAPTQSSAPADAIVSGVDQLADNGPHGGDLLAAAATYIGITPEALRTELGITKSLADVAVAHGKTRDGLITALTAASATQIGQLVDQKGGAPRPGGPNGGPNGGPGRAGFGPSLAAAGTYLGITADDLRTKLQSGQTLAQVANATSGKSRDGLIQALVADANAKIDQALKDGKISADQAAQQKATVTARVTAQVDMTGPGPNGGPRR